MTDLNEVITTWATDAGGGFKSVMYFLASGGTINAQRQSVHTLWETVETELNTSTVYSQEQEGRIIEAETGTLQGLWTDGEAFGGFGTDAAEPVPDASQVLMRWNTNTVIGGRFLRGRTFVPGLGVDNVTNGNVSAGSITLFSGAMNTFVATGLGFCIWHRPTLGAGGGFAEVSGSSVWNELAVLRRRRK